MPHNPKFLILSDGDVVDLHNPNPIQLAIAIFDLANLIQAVDSRSALEATLDPGAPESVSLLQALPRVAECARGRVRPQRASTMGLSTRALVAQLQEFLEATSTEPVEEEGDECPDP